MHFLIYLGLAIVITAVVYAVLGTIVVATNPILRRSFVRRLKGGV